MALEYNPEVVLATTIFKEYRNSIDIYTEDCEKDKEFYLQILQKLLSDTNVVINDIYPIGNRRTVLKHCTNDTDTCRKKLYIVDGDIYLQYENITIPHLYVLDAYCIENYMICEDAICNLAYRLYGRKSLREIKTCLQISQMLENIAEPLINLFYYYSVQMECYGQFELRSIHNYLDDNTNLVDVTKINQRISEIKLGLIDSGIPEELIEEKIRQRKQKFPINVDTLLCIVSGKNFLLPYVKCHITKRLQFNWKLSSEALKINMVDKCDLVRLIPLKEAILAACI